MFYLLTSHESNRQNNNYITGSELLKKVDFILNTTSNIDDSNSNIINNNLCKNKIRTRL